MPKAIRAMHPKLVNQISHINIQNKQTLVCSFDKPKTLVCSFDKAINSVKQDNWKQKVT